MTKLITIAKHYETLGRGLTVLSKTGKYNPRTGKYEGKGKAPIIDNWVNNPMTTSQVAKRVQSGHNLGFVIGPCDLVVDVDPRNDGRKGLTDLMRALSIPAVGSRGRLGNFIRRYPTVRTGGGGYHFYMTTPGPLGRVRHTLPNYGLGVEFKVCGQQVVIPGSVHPDTGKLYEWDSESPWKLAAPLAPPELCEWIKRPVLTKRNRHDPEDIYCTPPELAYILAQLPVGDFNSDAEWFKMLCASHHATGGAGLSEFTEWSSGYQVGDPKSTREITTRWNSLSMDDKDPITAGTLIRLIREYGGTLPGDLEASDPLDDFEGHFAPEARDDIQETLQARQERREKMRTEAAARREARRTSVWDDVIDCPAAAEKPEPDVSCRPQCSSGLENVNNEKDLQNQYVDKPSDTADTWDDIIDNPDTDIDDSPKTLRSLQAQVARLTPGVDHKDVTTILRRIAGTSQVHRLVLIRDFCRNTGIPRGDVKAVLSSIGRNRENQTIVDDVPLLLSTLVRKTHYKGGKWLLRTRGLWYRYTGINWEPVEDDLIDQNILKTIVKWRKASKDDDISISSLMSPTERILRARQAIDGDPFQLGKVPRAIINVKNGELHVSPDGEVTLKPHSYSSYLLSGLKNVEYEPGSQCKRMDKALLQIFANDPDKEATIRHFWEIAGYCIQPKKNIPAWFLLQGSGSNGKSVLMRVLSELLGDAAVQMAIHEFGAPHALSVLPGKLGLIDDDVKRGVILPDDFMKKISENKPLYANPKKEKYFPFVSSLTPILASNHWPKIVDLSEGMVRRAYVIPFSRRFPPSKQNLDLAQTIVDKELNGVLIRALEGLRRLRQRGNFQPSPACLGAKRAWLYGANTTAAFMQDCIKRCAGARTPLSEIHDRYVDWCEDQELELKYRLTKRTLGEHFVSMGFTRSKSPDGAHRCLSDIELKEKEND